MPYVTILFVHFIVFIHLFVHFVTLHRRLYRPCSSPLHHPVLRHIPTANDYVKRFRRLCRLVPDVMPERLREVRVG